MAWIKACPVTALKPGESIRIDVVPPIALFNVDGEFYATDDVCTHEESSLSDGYISGRVVECATHFAKFDICSGEVLSLPATRPLATFSIKIEGDEVFVDAGDRAPATRAMPAER